MPGKKRKAVINEKEVAEYRKKLRKRAPSPPLKLPNEESKKYTVKSPYPQHFSISPNILQYVAKNPLSPNGHLKFIKTCKFLARMSRILPVKTMVHYETEDESEDDSDGDDDEICYKWCANKEGSMNLKNHLFKFWIYDKLCLQTKSLPNLASILVQQIHKCSLRELEINSQILTFGELQILVSGSKFKRICFHRNFVKNDDGSIVKFEKVFELLCCKSFTISLPEQEHGIGKNTANKMIEILSSEQIPVEQYIRLWDVPEDFAFHAFSEFLKTNMTGRQHTIDLEFADEISDAYKNHLQEFVNEIIHIRGIYAHTVPIIEFPDENEDAYDELMEMRYGRVEGILRQPRTRRLI